jgi:hypothetical protein
MKNSVRLSEKVAEPLTDRGHDGDVEGGGCEGKHIGVHDGEAQPLDFGQRGDDRALAVLAVDLDQHRAVRDPGLDLRQSACLAAQEVLVVVGRQLGLLDQHGRLDWPPASLVLQALYLLLQLLHVLDCVAEHRRLVHLQRSIMTFPISSVHLSWTSHDRLGSHGQVHLMFMCMFYLLDSRNNLGEGDQVLAELLAALALGQDMVLVL